MNAEGSGTRMFNDYSDITEKISERPQWWDEKGVPRYACFGPDRVADIYAEEAALLEISCGGCGTYYQVAFSTAEFEPSLRGGVPLADSIRKGEINYWDPPNYGCCRTGPSMSCQNLRVLEYWTRRHNHGKWERDPSLEMILPSGREGNEGNRT
jgi:hypothetical protein